MSKTTTKKEGARYVSDNPLTIFANILRGRPVTPDQLHVYSMYQMTPADIANVKASLGETV